ncbi:hypothetical protein Tco_0094057, partial [Tanacetum coccineum]
SVSAASLFSPQFQGLAVKVPLYQVSDFSVAASGAVAASF